MEEIEIKFPLKEIETVPEKLSKLGFRLAVERHLETNYLLDNASGSFRGAGRLLRVRKTPSRQTITFKGPVATTSKLKQREEIECGIESAEIMIRILDEMGFKITTEYSKYRTIFNGNKFTITLDETEVGDFLEVEGPSEEEVTRLGKELGYSERDYVRRSYAELIGERRSFKT